jgi:hypothetical protein
VFADNDAEGLRALKAKADSGPFQCELALALAGRACGFEVAQPPAWLLRIRAGLGLAMARGPSMKNVPPPFVLELLDAAEAFWRAEPWRQIDSDEPLYARFAEPELLHFEASVLGSAGQEFGVALYEGIGAVAAMRRARTTPRAAAKVNSIAVTFDPGPAFALDAIRGSFSMGGVPVPIRVEAGRLTPISSSEVLLLATALRAASAFTAEGGAGTGITTIGDLVLRVELRAYGPEKGEASTSGRTPPARGAAGPAKRPAKRKRP